MRPALSALLAVSLAGCVYHLRVESHPSGATMTIEGEDSYILPTDLHIKWRPKPYPVLVESPGYRPLAFRLTRAHIHELDFVSDVLLNPKEAFNDEPRRVLEVRLVPEHGPSGTWTFEDVNP